MATPGRSPPGDIAFTGRGSRRSASPAARSANGLPARAPARPSAPQPESRRAPRPTPPNYLGDPVAPDRSTRGDLDNCHRALGGGTWSGTCRPSTTGASAGTASATGVSSTGSAALAGPASATSDQLSNVASGVGLGDPLRRAPESPRRTPSSRRNLDVVMCARNASSTSVSACTSGSVMFSALRRCSTKATAASRESSHARTQAHPRPRGRRRHAP